MTTGCTLEYYPVAISFAMHQISPLLTIDLGRGVLMVVFSKETEEKNATTTRSGIISPVISSISVVFAVFLIPNF